MANENVGLAVGTTGGFYAHASAVTNAAANLIAKFEEGWSLTLEETFAEMYGQLTTRQQAELTRFDISLSVSGVFFKPGTFAKLWNITANATDNLKSVAAEVATSYTFTYATKPRAMQYLIECSLDGKTFHCYAPTAKIMSSTINFTNMEFVRHNVDLILYGATGTLISLLLEN